METAKSMDELIEEFINTLDLSYNSVVSYSGNLKRFAQYLKDNKIDRPTESDIVQYKNAYLKKKVNSATVQKYVVVLRRFFRWCYRHKYYENIAEVLTGEKIIPTFKRESLSIEQAKQLLKKAEKYSKKSIQGLRDYAIVRLIMTTGLRTVEVSRADVTDLVNINGEDRLYIQGKGHDAKDQFVKIPNEVKALIEDYLIKRNSDAEALFINHGNRNIGGRIEPRTISEIVKDLLRKIGIDNVRITAHSLRHTCATIALKNGASIQQVQNLLRHTSLTTTQIYAHNIKREEDDTEFIVNEALGKKK